MKKNLLCYVFALGLLTLFFACTEDKLQQRSFQEQPLNVVLASVNDSLLSTNTFTRGDEPKKDTVSTADVVKADCIGAVIGFFVGAKEGGNLTTAVICGVFGAVVNSVVEGCSDGYVVNSSGANQTTITDMIGYDNIIQKYLNIDSVVIQAKYNNSVSPLPRKYAISEKIGIVHNLMLDSIQNSTIYVALLQRTVPDTLTTLPMLKKRDYKHVVDNCLRWKEYELSSPKNNIELVMKYFLSIYERCILENDINKAYRILSTYIEVIDNRGDLSIEEKESLLAGLSVAWYSFNYWRNNVIWQSEINEINEKTNSSLDY